MADHPYLPLWTDAYIADTTDLSAEEHGIYLLLLMAAWRSPDCTLPDDDARLARMARVGTKKWKKVRPTIARFFIIEDGIWRQKRLTKEREWVEKDRKQKREAGKASAERRKQEAQNSFLCDSDRNATSLSHEGHLVDDKALKNKETGSTDVGEPLSAPLQHPHPHPYNTPYSPPGEGDNEQAKATKKKRRSQVPTDWKPSEKDRDYAKSKGLDPGRIQSEAEKFVSHHRAKGSTFADIAMAWRTWVQNAIKYDPPKQASQPKGGKGMSDQMWNELIYGGSK